MGNSKSVRTDDRAVGATLIARDGLRFGRLLGEHLRNKLDVVKTVILNKN